MYRNGAELEKPFLWCAVLKQLERLINRLLVLDQETLDELAVLYGKVIQLELINTTQPVISLIIGEQGIQVDTDYAGTGDVLIRGTPLNLLAYMRSSGQGRTTVTGDMEIKGDLGLAQDFQRLLHRFEVDWEEQAAQLVGDTLARKTSNIVQMGIDFLRKLKNKIELDLSEYALYETEVLPDREEVERFNNSVDVLRDDLERLKQRLHRISADLHR